MTPDLARQRAEQIIQQSWDQGLRNLIADALLTVSREAMVREREHLTPVIKKALMFLYDSEQGVNGVERMANEVIDSLEEALRHPAGPAG